VAAWLAHLVLGDRDTPAPAFQEAADALAHAVGLAALTLEHRVPLTAAIGTPKAFVRLDARRACSARRTSP
jgi:hypothetical protein